LGLLASEFRIFRKPLNVKPSTAEDITLACIHLHYFLSKNCTTKQLHISPGTINFEYTDNGTVPEGKGKGKVIPLQDWTGPEGSRGLRLPDFKTIGT